LRENDHGFRHFSIQIAIFRARLHISRISKRWGRVLASPEKWRIPVDKADTQVVIVGGGPAGALLSYLFSSRGIETILVERQSDFSREFRGEILMPSGIRALESAGFSLDQVATAVPDSFEAFLNGRRFLSIDADDLPDMRPTAVSQPELLESLILLAEKTGHFELRRGHTVRGVTRIEGGGVALRLSSAGSDREQHLRAPFVIGADGRSSIIRKRLAPMVNKRANPLDVVWFKVPYPESWPNSRARFELGKGHLLLAARSPDGLLQVAWVILKGTFGELRSHGIEEWTAKMADHVDPELATHLLKYRESLGRPFLLDVVTDRVVGWSSPDILLIGDAAHTMSPVGGQGLNLALRDAIVTANELVPAFRKGRDLDAAAMNVEAIRGPEIDQIQSLAAIPPKIAMGRTPLHGFARFLIARVAGSSFGRARGSRIGSMFLDGVSKVELTV
jgi:2-polyprenyl-6-methoxyphenol hydroxylase-like FAD-dependent oxidoreductase